MIEVYGMLTLNVTGSELFYHVKNKFWLERGSATGPLQLMNTDTSKSSKQAIRVLQTSKGKVKACI
jgi:hypothetical protein